MFRLLPLLALLALLCSQASGLVSPLAQPPPGPVVLLRPGGPPTPGGPPAPAIPREPPLGFEEARRIAVRAAGLVRQLQAGPLALRPTPQGQRLTLTLTYQGRPVATVTLRDDLSFADRASVPLLPASQHLPVLSSSEQAALRARVAALAASGLAQATGPHLRVALLSNGAAVADLRFDRATGILLAEPAGKGPPGDKAPKKPPAP